MGWVLCLEGFVGGWKEEGRGGWVVGLTVTLVLLGFSEVGSVLVSGIAPGRLGRIWNLELVDTGRVVVGAVATRKRRGLLLLSG